MRHQPRIKDRSGKTIPRTPMSTSASKQIEERIDFTMRRFGVSRSWIIMFAVGEFFGVDVIDFRTPRKEQSKPRKSRAA